MKQACKRLILPHILLTVLIICIVFVPNSRPTARHYTSFLAATAIMEGLFLLFVFKNKPQYECCCSRAGTGPFDIISIVWVLLIAWELSTSVFNIAHPVLIPCPENVFDTFVQQWDVILKNIMYSLSLLLAGFIIGQAAALTLGTAAGWIPRLRSLAYPIANVMAPIPPIVFSPYLVAIMPTFRSASLIVIVFGVFWPAFLNAIIRITKIEPNILDSARMLNPKPLSMITHILLPYVFKGAVSSLKVSLTTSMIMLNFAELMGATHGMGHYIQNSIAYANYTHAVAGILTIGIVVTVLSIIADKLQKVLIRWH